jgi:threonine synthase
MDVGAPSNFVRILDLYNHSHKAISEIVKGFSYSDAEIKEIVKKVFTETGYMCDPHGACGFEPLNESLKENELGLFLETAHPAKFTETVENILGKGSVELPSKLAEFMKGEKDSILLSKEYQMFKIFLTERN